MRLLKDIALTAMIAVSFAVIIVWPFLSFFKFI